MTDGGHHNVTRDPLTGVYTDIDLYEETHKLDDAEHKLKVRTETAERVADEARALLANAVNVDRMIALETLLTLVRFGHKGRYHHTNCCICKQLEIINELE